MENMENKIYENLRGIENQNQYCYLISSLQFIRSIYRFGLGIEEKFNNKNFLQLSEEEQQFLYFNAALSMPIQKPIKNFNLLVSTCFPTLKNSDGDAFEAYLLWKQFITEKVKIDALDSIQYEIQTKTYCLTQDCGETNESIFQIYPVIEIYSKQTVEKNEDHRQIELNHILQDNIKSTVQKYCRKCNSITKWHCLQKPKNITVHLLIRVHSYDSNNQKLKKCLSVPSHITYFDASYEIIAIIYHIGKSIENNNHYICIRKFIKEGIWCIYNDGKVVEYFKSDQNINEMINPKKQWKITPYLILGKKI